MTEQAERYPPTDSVLDCLGLTCPAPMMETAKRVQALAPGQVLLVLADDAANPADLYAWCHFTGHEYLGTDEVGPHFHTRLRKRASPNPGRPARRPATCAAGCPDAG